MYNVFVSQNLQSNPLVQHNINLDDGCDHLFPSSPLPTVPLDVSQRPGFYHDGQTWRVLNIEYLPRQKALIAPEGHYVCYQLLNNQQWWQIMDIVNKQCGSVAKKRFKLNTFSMTIDDKNFIYFWHNSSAQKLDIWYLLDKSNPLRECLNFIHQSLPCLQIIEHKN